MDQSQVVHDQRVPSLGVVAQSSSDGLENVGFERDPGSRRLVVISAIDNLMKGAAGQAVQCFNVMLGFEERTALGFTGLHPV